MEEGPDGTSSGVIRGTSQQIVGASTLAVGASPVARMQNLEGIAQDAHEKQEKLPEVTKAKRYNQDFKNLNFCSPFTDDINETSIPKWLKGPRVPPYDGTTNPNDHVSSFQWGIKMIPKDPKLWSLYFGGTLEGSARY
ncbi:unnamed protein product [Lactuca saligna]|uniref:Uncharacterized protein n=1 Tax=Lactuca saligna TaxID=75948 RepID=A0AA35YHI4_LACSI|nr:unnamed protein product [Lactuca saligna]